MADTSVPKTTEETKEKDQPEAEAGDQDSDSHDVPEAPKENGAVEKTEEGVEESNTDDTATDDTTDPDPPEPKASKRASECLDLAGKGDDVAASPEKKAKVEEKSETTTSNGDTA